MKPDTTTITHGNANFAVGDRWTSPNGIHWRKLDPREPWPEYGKPTSVVTEIDTEAGTITTEAL